MDERKSLVIFAILVPVILISFLSVNLIIGSDAKKSQNVV